MQRVGERIFLTGRPGVGKSRVMKEIIDGLRARGLKIAGILTPEIRRGSGREGFEIIDIASGERGVLAAVGIKSKYKVSKYGVSVEDIDGIVGKCSESLAAADVVIVDEIGKMEFFSKKFEQLIDKILEGNKPLIATLHRAYVERFAKFGKIIIVTEQNRTMLARKIIESLAGAQ